MAMCYRDREYCSAACATLDCDRNLTPEVIAAAERWYAGFSKPGVEYGAPIAQSDMSPRCPDYQPIKEKSPAV